ncbi:glycosyltransferase [Dysgonomonas sp. 520]|uniref:glycosyltransferase n=1 Tax=Dysgonomonas sp. 520 TaxID=2302931 RepID=UPI0013D2A69B|nr:glycosyltransferase [Dysgonomonas sp. 520]NDW09239.1 glycosyltransferase [Dysgonomonas sp. 520]
MKVFQVITVSEYGGAQSVVANLLEEMAKDESNTLFVLSGGEGESWQHLDSNIKRIKLDKHRKSISLRDVLVFFKLIYYRLKYRPDIVHLHSSKMGVLGRLAFSKKKIVYTIHGIDSVRKAFRKYLVFERCLQKRSASVIGVSKYDIECLKEEGITHNLSLVYNGVIDHSGEKANAPKFGPELERIKREYAKVIMCISRISPQKNFPLFIEIAKQMPQHAFVWIGNKEPVDNLPDNVFCLGECGAAHQCLTYSDVFILPTNYEGMPISVIEALSYSRPTVVSSVGGLTEIFDGTNGFALENKVEEFVDKINYILSSDDVYAQTSENARKTYLEHFTIDKMMSGYKTIYESVYNRNNKLK